MKEKFITMSRIAAVCALTAGAFYGLANYLLHLNGMDFGNAQIWIFRLAVIISVTWSVFIFKKRNQFYLSIPQGMGQAMLTSLFIGAVVALNTWLMREHIYPNYNQDLKEIIKANLIRKEQQLNAKRRADSSATVNPADTLGWTPERLDRQLNKDWGYYFTTQGGMTVDFLGSLAVGLMTGMTVCFMARRVKEDKKN